MAGPTLTTVLETIRARRDAIEATHGVRLIGVFGSLARGETGPESDVDVLYEKTGRPTLFDLAQIKLELEDLFGRPVDLSSDAGFNEVGRVQVAFDLIKA